MAISATHYRLLKDLRDRGELPQGGRILEIGQANWYGDADASEFAPGETDGFEIVRKLYESLMHPEDVQSIDLDPAAPGAMPLDLNTFSPGNGAPAYSLVINHGTAEHIFNIANVFRVMHDATVAGGLMIHESPFTGWVDHGFYCLQPTLFWDLAHANGYEIVAVWLEHLKSRTIFPVQSREHVLQMAASESLPNNAMLFVVYRKVVDGDFKVPQQGVYAGSISGEAQNAWRELR